MKPSEKRMGENDLPMPGETVVEDGEAVINGTTLHVRIHGIKLIRMIAVLLPKIATNFHCTLFASC